LLMEFAFEVPTDSTISALKDVGLFEACASTIWSGLAVIFTFCDEAALSAM
jgi:hypothetical protein